MSEIFNPGGGGTGTVTSVSGTANQIDVATGTTTAVVSLDAAASSALLPYAADTGTTNALVVTVPNIAATPTAGVAIRVKVLNSSSGATTLNVTPTGGSAWGAIAVTKRIATGVAAIAGSPDINAGGIYEFEYDGTQWVTATPSSTVYCSGSLTAHVILVGNSNNQLGTAANVSLDATNGFFSKINGETLAGFGVPFVRGVTSQKAETGTADANVLTVTPAATVGTYRVSVAASVSTATSGVIGFTLSYTDSNGNAQSNVGMSLFQLGAAAPALTFTTSAASEYYGVANIDTNAAAASIIVKWIGGGTTAAKVSAIVERMQ